MDPSPLLENRGVNAVVRLRPAWQHDHDGCRPRSCTSRGSQRAEGLVPLGPKGQARQWRLRIKSIAIAKSRRNPETNQEPAGTFDNHEERHSNLQNLGRQEGGVVGVQQGLPSRGWVHGDTLCWSIRRSVPSPTGPDLLVCAGGLDVAGSIDSSPSPRR